MGTSATCSSVPPAEACDPNDISSPRSDWVTSYKVLVSNDSHTWVPVRNSSGDMVSATSGRLPCQGPVSACGMPVVGSPCGVHVVGSACRVSVVGFPCGVPLYP